MVDEVEGVVRTSPEKIPYPRVCACVARRCLNPLCFPTSHKASGLLETLEGYLWCLASMSFHHDDIGWRPAREKEQALQAPTL